MTEDRSRRNVLRALGVATVGGLAGCTSTLKSEAGVGGSSGTKTATTTSSNTTATADQTATPSSAKTPTETKLVDDFEDLSKWTVGGGGELTSVRDSYAGSHAAKVVRRSGEPTLTRSVDLDLRQYNPSLAVKTTASAPTVVEVRLLAPDEKNQLVLREGLRPLSDRGWIRIDPGVSDVVGLPDLEKVSEIKVRLQGGSQGTAFWLDDLRMVPSPEEPTVALTFDDSRASQYKAFEVLREYDMPGTVATITDKVGTDGFLTMKQMDEMKSAGWEFASHTATQPSLLDISRLTAEREIVQAKQWLVDHGFEAGAQSFAYPYGKFDQSVTNFIDEHHEMAFRYLGPASAGSGRITEPLTASRGDGRHLQRSKRMIDLAGLYNDLEIFTFHGIGTGSNLSMSLSDFEDLVVHLDKSNARVVPLSTVASELQANVDVE